MTDRLIVSLRRLTAAILQNEYLASVGKMATGTGVSQLISLATVPAITRVYGAQNYGWAASYAAIVAILVPAAALCYDLAVMLPDRDDEAGAIIFLALLLALITSGVAGLVLVLTYDLWISVSSLGALGLITFLMPLSVFSQSATNTLMLWASRKKAFGAISRNRIVQGVTYATIALGAGLASGGRAAGMILATLVSVSISAVYLTVFLARKKLLPDARAFSTSLMRAVISKYRRFPLFSLWIILLNHLTVGLPVIIMASAFSPDIAAYFSIAYTVLSLPTVLIGQSIFPVFYERSARLRTQLPELRQSVIRHVALLFLIMALPGVAVLLVGPTAFALVFGRDWYVAGEFARFLIFASLLNFVTAPLSMVPALLNRQQTHLVFASITYGLRVLSLIAGVSSGDAMRTVALFSAGEALSLSAFLIWLLAALTRRQTELTA